MAEGARKKMSERVLIECRKQFWNNERGKLNGMLSWGEFTKMLVSVDLHLTNGCMNNLYRISDQQKHGCIYFNEFLQTYIECELRTTTPHPGEDIHDMSAQMLNNLRKYFFDKDKKRYGRITRVEFAEMIFTLGLIMTNKQLNDALGIGDGTKDGRICFEEFICYFLRGMKGGNREAAELEIIGRCFMLADTDGDGKLSRSEFQDLLKSAGLDIGQRQASRLFSNADTDNSGSITFNEFKEVCSKTKFSFRCIDEQVKPDHVQLSALSRNNVIKIREYFAKYDRNRDGKLSREELHNLVNESNMEDLLKRRLHGRRKSKDLSITFREFVQLFSSLEEIVALKVTRKKYSEG